MFKFELTRVVLAAVGAFVLSTLSVTAAVGPGYSHGIADPAFASVLTPGIAANA